MKNIFCVNNFKSYINRKLAPVVRDLTYFLYSNSENNLQLCVCYNFLKSILRCKSIVPFKIINHRLYSDLYISSSINRITTDRLGYSSNLVYNLESEAFLITPRPLPDICLIKHENVIIQGDSDFIIDVVNNYAINDFSFNMDSRYENIDGILLCQKENLALLRYDGEWVSRNLKSGIMLSGKFSQNYYHQMYEIMIKFQVLDKVEIPIEIPLIIDEIIFNIKSFKQLFESLNKTGRRIEIIGAKEILKFEILFCFSAVNIIPPNRIQLTDDILYDIVFDRNLLFKMRENLLVLKSSKNFPKKIFISRKSTNNRRYNEEEVISLVRKFGFIVISPEEYDLFDQIAIFNGADFIVGASGAAFTNLLFCNNTCKVICMQPRRLNIAAFTTIAYTFGIEMRYCLGFPDGEAINTSYKVNLEMLEAMLNVPWE